MEINLEIRQDQNYNFDGLSIDNFFLEIKHE